MQNMEFKKQGAKNRVIVIQKENHNGLAAKSNVYTFLKIPAIVVSSTSTTLRSYYTLVTFSLNGNFGNTGWLLPSKPPFLLLEHVQKSAPGVHRVVVSKGDTKHTSVNQKSYPLLETQVRLEFEVLNLGWKCDIC